MAAEDKTEDKETESAKGSQATALVRFGQTTSVKGISRAVRTPANPVRCMWLLAGVIGFTVGIAQTIGILQQYLSYGVTTKTSAVPTSSVQFPAVSICNLNPLNLNFENMDDKLNSYLSVLSEIDESLSGTLDGGALPDTRRWDEIEEELISISGFLQQFHPKDISSKELRNSTVGMVVHCLWVGWEWSQYPEERCLPANVTTAYNSKYLACSSISLSDDILKKGEVRGLSVVVYINDFLKTHLPLFQVSLVRSMGEGVRVQVHPSNTIPDFKTGASVAPGTETTFHLKKYKKELLQQPYGHCLPIVNLSEAGMSFMGAAYANEYLKSKVYTSAVCMDLCHQHLVIDLCKCVNSHLLVVEEMFVNNTYCGFIYDRECTERHGESQASCLLHGRSLDEAVDKLHCSLHEADPKGSCTRQCFPPCEEDYYDYSITQTTWPHESNQLAFWEEHINGTLADRHFNHVYEPLYKDLLGSNHEAVYDELLKVNLIRRNYLQLNFMFEESMETYIQETPSITMENMLASLGGLMNLWAGITFYTLFEFVELAYYLIKNEAGKRCGKRQKVEAE